MHFRSIQDIDLNKLKEHGITNLIVDLDETLRKRNSSEMPEASVRWIRETKAKGFNICISSNNPFFWRNTKLTKLLGVPVSTFALKPLPFSTHHAMWVLKSKRKNTALIGDQLFTDILGANLAGVYSILVDPITGVEKGFFRRIMRWFEQKVFPRVNLDLSKKA
jgi:uncharacterized protein